MRKLALLSLMLLGTGCPVYVPKAIYHQDGSGTPFPTTAAGPYRIAPGASTVIEPGTQAGYGITANTGGSYRVFWTGDTLTSGVYSEFWGSMWTRGRFSNYVPGCRGVCDLESDDFTSVPYVDSSGAGRIDWDTFTSTALDGFDVVASDEPVYFDFFIDGVRYPSLVFFPSYNQNNQVQIFNTDSIPFGLTTQ